MILPSEGVELFDAAHKSAQHTLLLTFTSYEITETEPHKCQQNQGSEASANRLDGHNLPQSIGSSK